jgi:hypothetical protein
MDKTAEEGTGGPARDVIGRGRWVLWVGWSIRVAYSCSQQGTAGTTRDASMHTCPRNAAVKVGKRGWVITLR